MDNNQKIKKLKSLVRGNTGLKFTTIAIFLFMVILLVYFIYLCNMKIPDAKYALDTDKQGEFVKYDVDFLTDAFAVYSVDNKDVDKYYLAMDSNNSLCILKIDDSNLPKFNNILSYTYGETDEKPEKIEVYGVYKKIPSELKNLALDFYNEISNEEIISKDNFENYFGSCYISTFETPYDEKENVIMIIEFIFLIIFIGVFTALLSTIISTNKTLKRLVKENKLDEIYDLINSPDTDIIENQNIMLTNKYIICYNNKLEIIKYSDIIWIYEFIQRYNGIEISRYIRVLLKNKKYTAIFPKKFRGNDYTLFQELFTKICEKCPNALIGYNNENITATRKKNLENTIKEIEEKNISL